MSMVLSLCRGGSPARRSTLASGPRGRGLGAEKAVGPGGGGFGGETGAGPLGAQGAKRWASGGLAVGVGVDPRLGHEPAAVSSAATADQIVTLGFARRGRYKFPGLLAVAPVPQRPP